MGLGGERGAVEGSLSTYSDLQRMEIPMSENVMLQWTNSLESGARRALALDLLSTSAAPAVTLLARYAKAQKLHETEVAGLLPAALIQAQVAAHAVLQGLLGPTKAQRSSQTAG